MKNERHLFSDSSSFVARFSQLCSIFFLFSWFFVDVASVVAQDLEPYDATKFFGDPDEFVENFELGVKEDVNQYMGTGIAVSGFILVLRSFMS